MLPNAHLLAKIGADTAENDQKFAKIGNYATGPLPAVAEAVGGQLGDRINLWPGIVSAEVRRRRRG